jgi:protein phosphatase 2C
LQSTPASGPRIYAVADGHGPDGQAAARAAVAALVANATVKGGVRSAFAAAAAAVDALAGSQNSGATATLAVVDGSTLTVGNVGDSDAVLVRRHAGKDGHLELTVSHRPANNSECKRVEATGAIVDRGYVCDKPLPEKMISITRSLGDRDVRSLGIIAEPDIRMYDLADGDDSLIVATDGLWDAQGGDISQTRAADVVRRLGIEAGCHELIEMASGSCVHPIDDCTIMIIDLNPNTS